MPTNENSEESSPSSFSPSSLSSVSNLKSASNAGHVQEEQQTRVFTKWINAKIACRNLHIEELAEGLANGVVLCHLLEILNGGISLGRFHSNPRHPIHARENLTIALSVINRFIDEAGVRIAFDPEIFLQKDRKRILGAVWVIILKFAVSHPSHGQEAASGGLLMWVNSTLKNIMNHRGPITNFTSDWCDGIAFLALLYSYNPDLVDLDRARKRSPEENLTLAFLLAENQLQVPSLLDPDDFLSCAPDEKSVILYVSQIWKKFALEREASSHADQISLVLRALVGDLEAEAEYERRTHALLEWISASRSKLDELRSSDSMNADSKIHEFSEYRAKKSQMLSERVQLEFLLHTISLLRRIHGKGIYCVSPSHDVETIDVMWSSLERSEALLEASVFESYKIRDVLQLKKEIFSLRQSHLLQWISERKQLICQDVKFSSAAINDRLHILPALVEESAFLQKRFDDLNVFASTILRVHVDEELQEELETLSQTFFEYLQVLNDTKKTTADLSAVLRESEAIIAEYVVKSEDMHWWLVGIEKHLTEETPLSSENVDAVEKEIDAISSVVAERHGDFVVLENLYVLLGVDVNDIFSKNARPAHPAIRAFFHEMIRHPLWSLKERQDQILKVLETRRETVDSFRADKAAMQSPLLSYQTASSQFREWLSEKRQEDLESFRREADNTQAEAQSFLSSLREMELNLSVAHLGKYISSKELEIEWRCLLESFIFRDERERESASDLLLSIDPGTLEQIRSIFCSCDRDSKGYLISDEFQELLSYFGFEPSADLYISLSEGTGFVTFSSFVEWLTVSTYSRVEVADLQDALASISQGENSVPLRVFQDQLPESAFAALCAALHIENDSSSLAEEQNVSMHSLFQVLAKTESSPVD